MHPLHLRVKLPDHLRILVRQIGSLLRIILQIIQFQWRVRSDGHAFPVAFSGRPLLARKFPIEHTVVGIHLFPVEKRQDIHAVDALRQIPGNARQRGEGWHEVGKIDDVFQFLYGHLPRLVNDERHPYTTFVELSFSSPESSITIQFPKRRLNGGPIVRSENNQCVFPQFQSVQFIQQSADRRIHVRDERSIPFGIRSPRFLSIVPGRLVNVIGFVWRIKSQIEEERILLVPIHEGNGIVHAQVIVVDGMLPVGIFFNMDERVTMESVIRIIIGRITVDGGNSPSIKLVKAAMVG